ncbi:hypothetical protein [Flammeovirga sp. OC4]|uniref:hypothetical protein n=1 Tax=Flammeovirga sp. OC4 TaxID=1382345 RepID=UPI0005C56B6E|nr:hypothetical protein [Flammeovirga sp. OC4]
MGHDILLDEDGDLLIVNGDFVIGESDEQNVRLNIESNKGDWKEFPTAGFGIENYINSVQNKTKFSSDLAKALDEDGYQLEDLNLDQGIENFELNFKRK